MCRISMRCIWVRFDSDYPKIPIPLIVVFELRAHTGDRRDQLYFWIKKKPSSTTGKLLATLLSDPDPG